MAFIKKIVEGEQRYIGLCGLKIPYDSEDEGFKRIFHIGPLTLSCFEIDPMKEKLCLRLFGKLIPLKHSPVPERYKHYLQRDTLTDERRKEIMVETLTTDLGYVPDLDDPKTFNEKIGWTKLHVHDPLITTCCDKYAVKAYAAPIIGEEHVLPVIGAWENADDIDFDKLPNSFALKVNWSSGFNIIVKDKSKLDTEKARRTVRQWMRPEQNSYYSLFNWGYKNMKPMAFAEPYIEQIDGQVYDYKFYFTNGEFIYMFIATDRHGDEPMTFTFFDKNLQFMPFTKSRNPNGDPLPSMPRHLDEMLEMAKKLAKPFPFVRVDFYEVGDAVYLGEMTFYSGGGRGPFDPPEWDRKLGDLIDLSKVKA